MSLQLLNEQGSTRIERGDRSQIEVELTVQGGPARLTLEGTTPDYVPVGHHKNPLELVAALAGPARIVACPLEQRFPDGTTVQFTVRSRTGERTAQVVGPRLDVGALPRVDLAEIRPLDEQFTFVQALRFGFGGPSEGLTELGRAAHSVARELAWSGLVDRAPAGLAVCLDASASMLGSCRSGLLQALIEVVLGIDRGLGKGEDVPVLAVGSEVRRLEPITAANAATYVSDQFLAWVSATGFRANLLTGGMLGGQPPSEVLVVTDAVPADVQRYLDSWSAKDEIRWRLAVLAPPDAALSAAPWVEHVGFVDPDSSGRAALTNRWKLRDLVLALMGPAKVTRQEV